MKTDSCSSASASVATKAPPELIILLDQREPFWTGVYVFPANDTLQYNTIQYRTVAYRRELAIRFWARKYKKGNLDLNQDVAGGGGGFEPDPWKGGGGETLL